MGMSGSDQLPCHHKMVIGEITRSHQLIAKLRSLLFTSPAANDLFEEVLESYKVSVSMLRRPCGCFAEASEVNGSEGSRAIEKGTMDGGDQPERMDIGYAHAPRKEPLSKTSTKTTLPLDGHQWKMSGKKKSNNGDIPREDQKSWTIVTPAPHFDGHQWRKYGEKHITNSEFPRNYYRCSHFKEQGCQATKTIQQKEGYYDEPAKFIVTYKMHHTCKSMAPIYPLFVESTTQRAPIISFASGDRQQRKKTETIENEKDFKRNNMIISSSVPMSIDLNLTIESK